MKFIKRQVFLAALFLGLFFPVHAQLTVQGGLTAQQLADVISGPGIQVFNVTMNCPNGASGSFDGTNTNININSGILLTSGTVANAALPQTSPGITAANNAPGDADLNNVSGVTTFDACALEFDFVSSCDTIAIAYVFASDEYDEWVCSTVNDVFGFFVTGPGLNNVNIARIPGTNIPVAINSVNNGAVGANGFIGAPGCDIGNSAFFTSNNLGTTHEYDGQTIRMEAKTWVMPCDTYHVKLVVADGGDEILDSGVFLEEDGIRCTSAAIEISTVFSGATSSGGYIVEGCNDAELQFVRTGNLSQGLTVQFNIGGTAINGVDYAQLADSIVFAPLQDTVSLFVTAPNDLIVEGSESILIIIGDTTCGIIFADTAEVLIVDPPNADFNFANACVGLPVIFTDVSSFPPGTITAWDWGLGDGNTSAVQNPIHSYANPGSYNVTLIITTSEGCMDTITQQVDVFDPPSANFSFSGQCFGQTTVFTDLSNAGSGTPIATWNYAFGDGNSSPQPSPSHTYTSDGSYSVQLIVTNQNGCSDTSTQIVDIHPKPVAEFGYSDVCDGNAVQFTDQTVLSSGSLVLHDWDLGDGNSQNQTAFDHIYAGPGTYTVELQVETDNGCRDTVDHDVTVHPKPETDFSWNDVCDGFEVQFQELTVISAGSINQFDWDLGDGNSENQAAFSHTYAGPGLYPVVLEVESDQGCRDTVTHDVTVHPKPEAEFTFADVCDGLEVQFQDQTTLLSGSLISHDWDLGDGNTSTQASFAYTYAAPGTYTVVLMVETDNGCRDTISHDVTIHPNPIVDFAASFACEGDTSFFTDQSSILTGSIVSYDWDFGDGDVSTDQNPYHIYSVPGTYTASLTLTSDQGCVTTLSIPVVLPPGPPAPTPLHDTVCTGFEPFLAAIPPNVPGTINWLYSPNSTHPFHSGNTYTPGPIIEAQTYYLQYVSDEGCKSSMAAIVAAVNVPPQVPIQWSSEEVEIPSAIVEFTADPPNSVVGQLWTFGDGFTSTQTAPVHQYAQPGLYDVTYWLVDENGCERIYEWPQLITVTEEVYIWAPNAFTPNNDGTNDTYSVTTRLVTDFNIKMYDRWGKLILESDNMSFEWDGTDHMGQPATEGVYTYVIIARDYLGRPLKVAGTITLYR